MGIGIVIGWFLGGLLTFAIGPNYGWILASFSGGALGVMGGMIVVPNGRSQMAAFLISSTIIAIIALGMAIVPYYNVTGILPDGVSNWANIVSSIVMVGGGLKAGIELLNDV